MSGKPPAAANRKPTPWTELCSKRLQSAFSMAARWEHCSHISIKLQYLRANPSRQESIEQPFLEAASAGQRFPQARTLNLKVEETPRRGSSEYDHSPVMGAPVSLRGRLASALVTLFPSLERLSLEGLWSLSRASSQKVFAALDRTRLPQLRELSAPYQVLRLLPAPGHAGPTGLTQIVCSCRYEHVGSDSSPRLPALHPGTRWPMQLYQAAAATARLVVTHARMCNVEDLARIRPPPSLQRMELRHCDLALRQDAGSIVPNATLVVDFANLRMELGSTKCGPVAAARAVRCLAVPMGIQELVLSRISMAEDYAGGPFGSVSFDDIDRAWQELGAFAAGEALPAAAPQPLLFGMLMPMPHFGPFGMQLMVQPVAAAAAAADGQVPGGAGGAAAAGPRPPPTLRIGTVTSDALPDAVAKLTRLLAFAGPCAALEIVPPGRGLSTLTLLQQLASLVPRERLPTRLCLPCTEGLAMPGTAGGPGGGMPLAALQAALAGWPRLEALTLCGVGRGSAGGAEHLAAALTRGSRLADAAAHPQGAQPPGAAAAAAAAGGGGAATVAGGGGAATVAGGGGGGAAAGPSFTCVMSVNVWGDDSGAELVADVLSRLPRDTYLHVGRCSGEHPASAADSGLACRRQLWLCVCGRPRSDLAACGSHDVRLKVVGRGGGGPERARGGGIWAQLLPGNVQGLAPPQGMAQPGAAVLPPFVQGFVPLALPPMQPPPFPFAGWDAGQEVEEA